MSILDTLRTLISGYLGIGEMDEYTSKEYILKEVSDYINEYMTENGLDESVYIEEKNNLEKLSLDRKLQDSILVLNMIDGPIDLKLLIRNKLSELGK